MTIQDFHKNYLDNVASSNPATIRHRDLIGSNLLTKDVLHGSSFVDFPNVEVKQLFWSSPYGSCLASNNTLGYTSRLAALCVWSFSVHLLAEKATNLHLVTDNDGARLAMSLRLPYRYIDGSLQSLTSGSQGTAYTEAYARLMDLSVTRHTSPTTMYVGRDVLLFRLPSIDYFAHPSGIVSYVPYDNESVWKQDVFRACASAVHELITKKVEFKSFDVTSLLDYCDVNSSVVYISNKSFRALINKAAREVLMTAVNVGLSSETVSVLSERLVIAVAAKAGLICQLLIPPTVYRHPAFVGSHGYVEVNLKKSSSWTTSLFGRFQARYPLAYDRCCAIAEVNL